MKGRAIIRDVMQSRRIGVKDFFGASRMTHLVNARRIAIMRLKKAGFNDAAIARLMKRNYSTVRYWLRPDYRQRSMAYSNAYWTARRAERQFARAA